MNDNFESVLTIERIDLLARLAAGDQPRGSDYKIAIVWIAEIIAPLHDKARCMSEGSDFQQ